MGLTSRVSILSVSITILCFPNPWAAGFAVSRKILPFWEVVVVGGQKVLRRSSGIWGLFRVFNSKRNQQELGMALGIELEIDGRSQS